MLNFSDIIVIYLIQTITRYYWVAGTQQRRANLFTGLLLYGVTSFSQCLIKVYAFNAGCWALYCRGGARLVNCLAFILGCTPVRKCEDVPQRCWVLSCLA